MKKILNTNDSWSPLVLRVLLGVVIFAHGAQKLFGWFGGHGFNGTLGFLTDIIGVPWILAFLVIMLESFGALALIAGLGTRLLSLAFLLHAVVIIFTVHIQNGFFMNWFGNQSGEGYEFFILWIALALGLLISGGGKFSMDRKLAAAV